MKKQVRINSCQFVNAHISDIGGVRRQRNRRYAIKPLMGLTALACIITTAFPITANAAGSSSVGARQSAIYKTPFPASLDEKERLLDWRNPVAELPFTLPENDWIDEIELLISAQPEGRVSPTTPLLVRFNQAPAVPIYSDGNGFDARIKLDRSFLKGQGNVIRAEYQTPPGKACLGSEHGTWAVNIKDSQVVIHARSKSRPPSLSDVKSRLTNLSTAPKSVAIRTKGTNTSRLQVLAAQGISLNMRDLPTFKTHAHTADFNIIISTRSVLPQNVREKTIMNTQGPLIAVSQSETNTLVITGDTDADLLTATQTFAENPIPRSRHSALGPTGFYGSDAFSRPKKLRSGKMYLSKLGLSQFEPGWRPNAQHIYFDVADPASASGELDLKVFIDGHVAKTSVLNVALNGEMLERIPVSGSRTVQTVKIPQGLLKGLRNHLTLSADLFPEEDGSGCRSMQERPRVAISSKSTLSLTSDFPSAQTDLSRFAATGLPFAKQSGTAATVLVAATSAADRDATLKLMAKLAQASGTGWAGADIRDATIENWPTTGNVLVVGADMDSLSPVLGSAPKSLMAALSGQSRQTPRLMKSAAHRPGTVNLLSSREWVTGGVAAIYQDELIPGRFIGVITGSPGHSFPKAVNQLVNAEHWNRLEGSVARWDKDTVLMAQTAVRDLPQSSSEGNWTRLTASISEAFANVNWPDFAAWKDRAARVFEPKSNNTIQDPVVPMTTDEAAPALRTELRPDPKIEGPTRIYSGTPVPRLKPTPALKTASSSLPGTRPEGLHSVRSQRVVRPQTSIPSISVLKANIAQSYTANSARLSQFMTSIVTDKGYAKPANRPGVLLLSLIATFALLLMAVFMPMRRKH